MRLRPFFNYFGGKWKLALKYQRPRHNLIIEPFAGGANYALAYPGCDVILYDVYPVIAGIWDYLIHVSEAEFLALPTVFARIDQIKAPQAARDFVGFWIGYANHTPRKSYGDRGVVPTNRKFHWNEELKLAH